MRTRGAAQRNDVFSLKGTKGPLGAMMGGPEQGSPIIACGLCHLILTLCAQSLNAQTSVSSLGQRNDEAYDYGLDITKAV